MFDQIPQDKQKNNAGASNEEAKALAPPPPMVVENNFPTETGHTERKAIYIIVAVFFIILLAGGLLGLLYYRYPISFMFGNNKETTTPAEIVCKSDTKLCSDGSIVGRIAPDCEYQNCPEIQEPACRKEGEEIIFNSDDREEKSKCCPGLRIISSVKQGVGFCTKCGNGICLDPEEAANCPEDCLEEEIKDRDKDFLSDKDEAIYGTDPDNPDTDGDGYLDGEEVLNGYNPTGEGKIIK